MMASEDEAPAAAFSESEAETDFATDKEDDDLALTDVEEEHEDDDEDDEVIEEVVMLLCVLNLDDRQVLKKRKIWRRVAVPADFSLLELHVALQNAFDWEDTHLHDFTQPHRHSWRRLLTPAAAPADELSQLPTNDATSDSSAARDSKPAGGEANKPAAAAASLPPLPDTRFRGFGRTDLSSVAELLALDLDALPAGGARTFRSVAGRREEEEGGADGLTLTPVGVEGLGGGGEKDDEGKGGLEVVFVEHSEGPAVGEGLALGPNEVLDERAFEVGSVFSLSDPLLLYQYDFGMSHEVCLIFEGKFPATEGVNYPTCLAGVGASPAEDGNDMDEQGGLLPSYEYKDFAVLDVLASFEKTFEDCWPVGPGAEDSLDAQRCYMCRYNRECSRRRDCTGHCCSYCLKHPLHLLAGSIALRDVDAAFQRTADLILGGRKGVMEGDAADAVAAAAAADA